MARSSAMRAARRAALTAIAVMANLNRQTLRRIASSGTVTAECGRGAKSADLSNQERQDQVPARGSARPWRGDSPRRSGKTNRQRNRNRLTASLTGSTRAHIAHRGKSRSGLFVASEFFLQCGRLLLAAGGMSPLMVEIPSELKSKVVSGRLSRPHDVARRVGVKLRQNVPAPLQQRCRHT
jgi:hypothetical protein